MEATVARGPKTSFPEMFQQVRAAGLMDRRPGYYIVMITLTVAALAAGWAGLFVVGDSWVALAVALFLGLASTQVVFVGHDAGHHQIFSTRRANGLVGLAVGNLLTGLSFGWWVPKHAAHHSNPNTADRDPDIGAGVIAFTAAHAQSRPGFSAWAARHQAALFFPLLFLEAIGLHVASVRSLAKRQMDRAATVETLLLVAHVALYLTAILWVLSPARAIAFIAVQQGTFGFYLGCSFAPNHKGMPIIGHDSRLSFATAKCLPPATSTAAGSARSCWAAWITRSNITCSRPCPARTYAKFNRSSERSAPITVCPTAKPPPSARTARPSATSAPSAQATAPTPPSPKPPTRRQLTGS